MKRRIIETVLLCLFVFTASQGIANDFYPDENFYFSTEEDFVSKNATGLSQVVSDGDLLNWQGFVYMKNSELLQKFDESNDLGLDAADVIIAEKKIVAFSTELDSTHGIFSAGDLLATNGARITNKALLIHWQFPVVPTDMGLDAVQFRGEQEMIYKYLEYVASKGWDYYEMDPYRLPEDLKEFKVDIWFSTEGTAPYYMRPLFLDGDLLSASTGSIVIGNSSLLHNTVPAGIPSRGVDFGLDAFMSRRLDDTPMYFSTEILYYGEKFPFTDGDVLMAGVAAVILTNPSVIKNFMPPAYFLGLDATSYSEK